MSRSNQSLKYDVTHVQPGENVNLKVDHPVTTWVAVSSEVAARWLQYNTHNRPVSTDGVLKWQADMEAGRWNLDGAPIRFSKHPVTLLDGQNRLTALANTVPSMTLVFNVIRGLDHEVQRTMDIGHRRTLGNQLTLDGRRNGGAIGAAAKFYLIWQKGWLFEVALQRRITNTEIEDWVDAHDSLVAEFTDLVGVTRSVGARPMVAGAFAMRGLQLDAQATVAFLYLLKSRAGLPEGSPILALDNRLRRNRLERITVPPREELGLFLTAWNHWLSGTMISKIQGPKGGYGPGNFPAMDKLRRVRFDQTQFQRGLEMAGVAA